MNRPPGSFSRLERSLLAQLRRIGGPAILGIARPLARLGVSPNAVSLLQIPIGGVIAWLLGQSPILALALFVVALLLDGIDGTLARATGKASAYGALTDQVADHLRELTVMAGFAFAGLIDGGIATLYAAAYPLTNALLWIGDRCGRPAPLSAKVWITFYPFFALWAITGIDWLEPAALASIGLLLASSGWQLWILRGNLIGNGPSFGD